MRNLRFDLGWITVYAFLLVPSLVLGAALWQWFAPDRLYHCWDALGPMSPLQSAFLVFGDPLGAVGLIANSAPPFVHSVGPLGNGDFDHFLWPASAVYLVWLGVAGLAILAPALVTSKLLKSDARGDKAQSYGQHA